MGFRVFTIAAVLSLPKQYAIVYLGTLFVQDKQQKTTTSKIITWTTLIVTGLVSAFACWYVYVELKRAVPKADPTGALRHKLYPEDYPAPIGVQTDDSRTPLTAQAAGFGISTVSLAGGDPDDKRYPPGHYTHTHGPSTSTVGFEDRDYAYPSESAYDLRGRDGRSDVKGLDYSQYQPEYPPAPQLNQATLNQYNSAPGAGVGGRAAYVDPYAQQQQHHQTHLPYPQPGRPQQSQGPPPRQSSNPPSQPIYPSSQPHQSHSQRPRNDSRSQSPPRQHQNPYPHQYPSHPPPPFDQGPTRQLTASPLQDGEAARRRYIEGGERPDIRLVTAPSREGGDATSPISPVLRSPDAQASRSPPPQQDGRRRYELSDGQGGESWRT